MTRLLRILLLLASAALLFALPVSQASAKEPCWRTLLNDWYDGVVDDAYPLSCYTQTLAHLRDYEDLSTYSTARDDISRAKQVRIAELRRERSDRRNETPVALPADPPPPNGNKSDPPPGTFVDPTSEKAPSTVPTKVGLPSTTKTQGRNVSDKGPVGSAIDKFGPNSADSLPVPLLVLGGLACLLMLAGGAGFLARRAQSRRLPVQPASVPVESPRP
jgi:hypothetical protein